MPGSLRLMARMQLMRQVGSIRFTNFLRIDGLGKRDPLLRVWLSGHHSPDGLQQLLGLDGLGQGCRGAEKFCRTQKLASESTGEGDDFQLRPLLAEQLYGLESVHV